MRQLAGLGRIHSPQDTTRAAEELHAAGLSNFNLDLMYALPGQDLAGAMKDVEQRWLAAGALVALPAHARAWNAICRGAAGTSRQMISRRRCSPNAQHD